MASLRHVVIGTAGHVDHGKTALVHRLTGVMTDRLPEEQRRGITIELGFAPWRIADDLLVSVIDAPGHRRLVHNMIAGATGIDIVLLVVAADEGVMPQTREHLAACRLLEVRRAVVAVTKIDRVERDLAELAGEEAVELLEESGIAAETVLCSSKTGEGIEDLRAAMVKAIEETGLGHDRAGRVRLSVDRVFTVKGAGTVVTGTLVQGELRVGAPLRILGPSREATTSARALHVHGESRDQVAAPTRLAINLGGVSLDEVERGDVITDDADAMPSRVLDVWLQPLEPIKRGSEASLFIGTARSIARAQPVDKVNVLEEPGLCRLRLNTPLVVLGGDRFVLRGARVDGPSGAVLGGGRVLDAHPPRSLRASKRAALLEALQLGDAEGTLLALAREQSPRPLEAAQLPARLAIDSARLVAAAPALVKREALVAVTADSWVPREAIDQLKERALELVTAHHKAAPLDPGVKLQTLRERLASVAGPVATEKVLGLLTDGKAPGLVIQGDSARLPSFRGAEADATASKALGSGRAAVSAAALEGITENAMTELLGDVKVTRAVLAKVVRDGEAIKAGNLWFHKPAIDALEAKVRAHLQAEGRITIAQFKDMTGLGRKQVIPLLEHFDRERITKREGSDRVKGSG